MASRSMTGMEPRTPSKSLTGCWPMSSNHVGKAVSRVPDGATLDEHEGQAADADEARQCDHQRGQPHDRHPEAIEEADTQPDQQGQEDADLDGNARLPGDSHDDGAQAHHRGHREVDLAIDDDEGHGQHDDGLLDADPPQVDLVLAAQVAEQIVGREDRVEHDDEDQDEQQQALPRAQSRDDALAQGRGAIHRRLPHSPRAGQPSPRPAVGLASTPSAGAC